MLDKFKSAICGLPAAIAVMVLYTAIVSIAKDKPQPTPAIEVWFAPGSQPENALVKEIDGAKSEIRILAYNFTSQPIVDALIAAKARGVDVQVVIDHKALHEKKCVAEQLLLAKIAVFDDEAHPIQHNKVTVLDGKLVVTGSYNYSVNAKKNAENLLIIRDVEIANLYRANWQHHAEHSQPFLTIRKGQDSKHATPTVRNRITGARRDDISQMVYLVGGRLGRHYRSVGDMGYLRTLVDQLPDQLSGQGGRISSRIERAIHSGNFEARTARR